ncbi:MAG: hypothetical protein JW827_00710, partial [Spirochaetes bacterium]|nr:hypothetical protein [Spirochaetota bacterium]
FSSYTYIFNQISILKYIGLDLAKSAILITVQIIISFLAVYSLVFILRREKILLSIIFLSLIPAGLFSSSKFILIQKTSLFLFHRTFINLNLTFNNMPMILHVILIPGLVMLLYYLFMKNNCTDLVDKMRQNNQKEMSIIKAVWKRSFLITSINMLVIFYLLVNKLSSFVVSFNVGKNMVFKIIPEAAAVMILSLVALIVIYATLIISLMSIGFKINKNTPYTDK